MLDLKNLISITPVAEDIKNQLIAAVDSGSMDKKFEIESFCWETILSDFELKKQDRIAQIMDEIAQGKRKYSQEEIKSVDEEIFNELDSKMKEIMTAEQIQEVREKLQQTQASKTS